MNSHVYSDVPYLGVHISSDVRWHNHVNAISAKATRALNFVRRNCYRCSPDIKTQAYFSLSDLITGRAEAEPCRYCFYSVVQKWVFRPTGATRCPDNREIWHGAADLRSAPPCQIGEEMWGRYRGRKRNVCGAIFLTKFSAFVRVYR